MHRNGKLPQGATATIEPSATLPTIISTQTTTQAAIHTAEGGAEGSAQPSRRLGPAAGASMGARLLAAQVAIETVTSDPRLQAIMATYGYDGVRMREGQELRER